MKECKMKEAKVVLLVGAATVFSMIVFAIVKSQMKSTPEGNISKANNASQRVGNNTLVQASTADPDITTSSSEWVSSPSSRRERVTSQHTKLDQSTLASISSSKTHLLQSATTTYTSGSTTDISPSSRQTTSFSQTSQQSSKTDSAVLQTTTAETKLTEEDATTLPASQTTTKADTLIPMVSSQATTKVDETPAALKQAERTTKSSFYSSTSPAQTEANVPVATSAITSTLLTYIAATARPDIFTSKNSETVATHSSAPISSSSTTSTTSITTTTTTTTTTTVGTTTPKAPITTKSPDVPKVSAHQVVTARTTSTTVSTTESGQKNGNCSFFCAVHPNSGTYIKKCSEFPRQTGKILCIFCRINKKCAWAKAFG